jgi:glycolate oxidase FAD binding subunit
MAALTHPDAEARRQPAASDRPATIEAVQDVVREGRRLRPRGNGTKPLLIITSDDERPLDMSALTGVVEYNPAEFTITALGGTRVATIKAALAEHGQYLPFDPPLARQGATLGGTVASGLSGPGRYRYGGLRDFILGIRFVASDGQLIRGGGKVVKNAAGFDLPKLFCGSLGRLGVLVEVTLKVFPRPAAYRTLVCPYQHLADALDGLYQLMGARLELDALDLVTGDDGPALWLRCGGAPASLPARLSKLVQFLPGGELVADGSEELLWSAARDFEWAPHDWSLLKVPLTPRRIPDLETAFAGGESKRRYSAGGNVAWLATPAEPAELHELLAGLGLAGLRLRGHAGPARLGVRHGESFERRIRAALDPAGLFGGD